MDQDLDQRLKALEAKLDKVEKAAESTRRYIFWTMVISIAVIVLPLIGLFFAIPKFIDTLNVGSLIQ